MAGKRIKRVFERNARRNRRIWNLALFWLIAVLAVSGNPAAQASGPPRGILTGLRAVRLNAAAAQTVDRAEKSAVCQSVQETAESIVAPDDQKSERQDHSAASAGEGRISTEETAGDTETQESSADAGGTAPVSFADTVFLGDSRTEGFYLYSGLKEGTFLYAQGATVESIFSKSTQETRHGTVPILDALDEMKFSRVYIMLGVNELGWVKAETFADQYEKVIDRIRQQHPDAQIVLQSILPVSAEQEAKGSYVNNERIAVYNDLIAGLAKEKDCTYLNVAESVSGTDGCLQDDLTFDGVHLNVEGCRQWRTYLEKNPV